MQNSDVRLYDCFFHSIFGKGIFPGYGTYILHTHTNIHSMEYYGYDIYTEKIQTEENKYLVESLSVWVFFSYFSSTLLSAAFCSSVCCCCCRELCTCRAFKHTSKRFVRLNVCMHLVRGDLN